MGLKTYLPTLYLLLRKICVYIEKHKPTIVAHLGDGGAAAIDAYLVACDVLEALVQANLIPPV